MTILGSCHCGNITFTLSLTSAPTEIAARACTCSFCRKHGAAWWSIPTGTLCASVRDPVATTRYDFATRTVHFHVCTRCGVVPLASCRIEDHDYAVVNVTVFDEASRALVRSTASELGNESVDARIARRRRTWTPMRTE